MRAPTRIKDCNPEDPEYEEHLERIRRNKRTSQNNYYKKMKENPIICEKCGSTIKYKTYLKKHQESQKCTNKKLLIYDNILNALSKNT